MASRATVHGRQFDGRRSSVLTHFPVLGVTEGCFPVLVFTRDHYVVTGTRNEEAVTVRVQIK